MLPTQPLLMVTAEEDGMKLLRFLERRLEPEPTKSQLHKWIRTGQVRVNGGRAKPFQELAEGDAIRIPPFAVAREIQAGPCFPGSGISEDNGMGYGVSASPTPLTDRPSTAVPDDISLIAETDTLLVLAKPAGLACQPGQGQRDSLGDRLSRSFAGRPYIPAPAHRIDKHTTGIVLAGKSLASQRRLHALFRQGDIGKEYLAWVAGSWAYAFPCLLEDRLEIRNDGAGRESIAAEPGGTEKELPLRFGQAGNGYSLVSARKDGPCGEEEEDSDQSGKPGTARCIVIPVGFAKNLRLARANTLPAASLLLIRLLTGRKHQIRVQLASRGCPIIGDGRYKGPLFSQMFLHAYAVRIPVEDEIETGSPQAGICLEYSVPPPWPARFMPEERALAEARQNMAGIESFFHL